MGPATSPSRIAYQPGLDGLRAVALLSIFLVHADIGLAPGGFLAVSTFFTLSGFLITTLLVREHRSTGRIHLVRFWGRRARRLLPAAVLGIVVIAAVTVALGDSFQVANLRGDVIGSLAYVANWRFLVADVSYAGAFAGQSPLLHYWSLAIEEQFYLLFPLIAMVALKAGSRRRWGSSAVLIGGIVASFVVGVVASIDAVGPDRLYFRSDIRAGELLAGALAGLWWTNRDHALSPRLSKWVQAVGPVALVVMIGLIATSDYRDIGWYRGGLIAYSFVSILVILAAVEPGGPVRRLLALRPLVHVGLLSYSAYIIHWPLFMWLSTRADLPDLVRLAVGAVAVLALAELAHRFVESPIRYDRGIAPLKLIGAGAVASAVALLVATVAPNFALRDDDQLDEAATTLEEHIAFTAAAKGEAPTVGVFGDSTGLVTSLGLAIFDDEDTTIRLGPGWAGLGCTITVPATYLHDGMQVASSPDCDGWLDSWAQAGSSGELDAAVVMFGPWDVKEMQPEGFSEPMVIGSPEVDAFIEERLVAGLDALVADVPVVVLLTSPYVEPGRMDGRSPAVEQPESDPARMDRLNEIIIEVGSRYPQVAIVDFAQWIDDGGEDRRLRPDGVHLTEEAAIEIAAPLAATIVEVLATADGSPDAQPGSSPMPVIKQATGS